MAGGVRRVITGHDERGKAVVIIDADTSNVLRPPARPGVAIHNVWRVFESPAGLAGNEDTTKDTIGLLPPKNGSVFRVINFPPEKDWIGSVDRAAAHASFSALGAGHAADASEKPPHPLMHKTESIDYGLVLEGEIYLVLDDSEVLLKTGDTFVQRGTNHAWSNRSDKDCKVAFVLIDGKF
ncbi:MAG: cupin domain-containing protein [Rhodospirillales bacterium]